MIKFVVVENCPYGNLLLRSGTGTGMGAGTKKILHVHVSPKELSRK